MECSREGKEDAHSQSESKERVPQSPQRGGLRTGRWQEGRRCRRRRRAGRKTKERIETKGQSDPADSITATKETAVQTQIDAGPGRAAQARPRPGAQRVAQEDRKRPATTGQADRATAQQDTAEHVLTCPSLHYYCHMFVVAMLS